MKTIIFFFTILFAASLTSSQAQNTWTQKTDLGGSEREGAVGFSIGSKGYIGTGNDSYANFKKDFWEYDPSTNAWTQKADFGGTGRSGAVGFSIADKGYIGTGTIGIYPYNKNDFWEYNPATNAWLQKANFGGTERYYAVGFSVDGNGYIGTGLHYDNGVVSSLKDFWKYDPGTNTWVQKADFGGGVRNKAVGFSIYNKGYIGTGRNDTVNCKDFWQYEPATNMWTQETDFGGTARVMAVGFSINGKGYIGTGDYPVSHNDFWEYDTVTNTWTQKADFGGTARFSAVGFSITNGGYIGGGYDITFHQTNDFWEYIPSLITTGIVSGSPFCPEAIINVTFTSAGTYSSGNVYTAQLSDKLGSFSAPVNIGTLSSTANSGTITSSVPSKPKAGSKYRIRVISNNPAVTGTDNGMNLKLIACKKVTALSASGITSNSATLSWTGVSCVAKYKIQYRKQGITSWITKNSTTNSYTITGLFPNTVYEYHVKTNCTEGGSSNSGFTSIQTFTTILRLSSDVASTQEMMGVYPNPAQDHATIQFTLARSSHVSIKVYDVSGKEIETLLDGDVEQGEHSLLLNINHFSKGVYLVKMISDFGIENQKLIVQ